MRVRDFLTIPSYFANRENTKRDYNHSYNILRWSLYLNSYQFVDGFHVLNFKVHSQSDQYMIYYVSIGIDSNEIRPDSQVKFYCTCPDFMYTFSHVLYKKDALLFPNEFPLQFRTIPPRKRNPQMIPFICKHCYTVLKFCIEKRIKFNEDEALKYNRYNRVTRPIFEIVYRFYKWLEQIRKAHTTKRTRR